MHPKLTISYILGLVIEESTEILEAYLLNDIHRMADETNDLIAVLLLWNRKEPDKEFALKYEPSLDWQPKNMLDHIDKLYPIIITSIQHMTSKCLRFGLFSTGPEKENNNITELKHYIETLVIYIQVMNLKYPGFSNIVYNDENILKKHNKINYFLEYSTINTNYAGGFN